jgi:hypothetical protein
MYLEYLNTSNVSQGYYKIRLSDPTLTSLQNIKDFLSIFLTTSNVSWVPVNGGSAPISPSGNNQYLLFTQTLASTTIPIYIVNSTIGFGFQKTSIAGQGLFILHNQASLANKYTYGTNTVNSALNFGPDAFNLNTAQSIFGLTKPILITTSVYYADYRANIQPEQVLYLCSQRLSSACRAFPSSAGLGSNTSAIAIVPVGGQANQFVDHDFIDATNYVTTGSEHLDEIDFSLRYVKGGLIDLGTNDWTIEIEVESVLLKNGTQAQMVDSIHLPNFNAYGTTQMLGTGKRRRF